MKDALKKSDVKDKSFEELLRARALEALASGPLETVGECFTPLTTIVYTLG